MELSDNGKCMVQHHKHYLEIDGYDEVIMMETGNVVYCSNFMAYNGHKLPVIEVM